MTEGTMVADTKLDSRCEYSNPIKALGHTFRHLFDFSGRATRKEFFMSLVGFAGLWCLFIWCGTLLGHGEKVAMICLFSVPSLTSLMVRRYHDFGYDGVLVVIVMLVFPLWIFYMPYLVIKCMLRASQEGCNDYGVSSRRLPLVMEGLPIMFPTRKSVGCAGWGCLTILLAIASVFIYVYIVLPPYVTHGQYSERVRPVIENVRTQIGLHIYEYGKLPGVNGVYAGRNGLYASPIQTFILDQDAPDGKYVPAYCADDYQTAIPIKEGDQLKPQMRHFAVDVGLDVSDLRDSMCKPSGYKYWATMASSNVYAYCIGYFPSDDCQMKPGTGYAVLEIFSTTAGKSLRHVAYWRRYKPIDDARIVLRPATNAIETAQSAGEGTCWLGHPELYLSSDPGKMEQGIRELKEAGWPFDDN